MEAPFKNKEEEFSFFEAYRARKKSHPQFLIHECWLALLWTAKKGGKSYQILFFTKSSIFRKKDDQFCKVEKKGENTTVKCPHKTASLCLIREFVNTNKVHYESRPSTFVSAADISSLLLPVSVVTKVSLLSVPKPPQVLKNWQRSPFNGRRRALVIKWAEFYDNDNLCATYFFREKEPLFALLRDLGEYQYQQHY